MTDRLAGKVALITGAARGMGASHARLFATLGARVILTDRDETGSALAEEIGDKALFLQQDVSRPDQWPEIVRTGEQRFGPINVLVNNAGIAPIGSFEEMTPDSLSAVLSVNCIGSAMGMNAVLPSMKAAGGGSIVNISSIAGLRGVHSAEYCISKFAITGMTKAAALSLAKHGVRVNSVHPGFIETDMGREAISRRPDALTEMLRRVPLGRTGKPIDISYLIAFLASDESGFCTGSEFTADGGQICQV